MTPDHLLHHLWTKAVGTPGYVKAEWVEMERAIVQLQHKLLKAHQEKVGVA